MYRAEESKVSQISYRAERRRAHGPEGSGRRSGVGHGAHQSLVLSEQGRRARHAYAPHHNHFARGAFGCKVAIRRHKLIPSIISEFYIFDGLLNIPSEQLLLRVFQLRGQFPVKHLNSHDLHLLLGRAVSLPLDPHMQINIFLGHRVRLFLHLLNLLYAQLMLGQDDSLLL